MPHRLRRRTPPTQALWSSTLLACHHRSQVILSAGCLFIGCMRPALLETSHENCLTPFFAAILRTCCPSTAQAAFGSTVKAKQRKNLGHDNCKCSIVATQAGRCPAKGRAFELAVSQGQTQGKRRSDSGRRTNMPLARHIAGTSSTGSCGEDSGNMLVWLLLILHSSSGQFSAAARHPACCVLRCVLSLPVLRRACLE